MKIIAVTGEKNSNKEWLARKLAENSDVIFIRPYTDKPTLVNQEPYEMDEYIHLTDSQLSYRMDREPLLICKRINGHRYAYFKTQLRADYCVIIVTADMIPPLKKEYGFELFTIYCHTGQGCDDPTKYDYVFNSKEDSYDNLEERVEYG